MYAFIHVEVTAYEMNGWYSFPIRGKNFLVITLMFRPDEEPSEAPAELLLEKEECLKCQSDR
jgi:hypothetical protein